MCGPAGPPRLTFSSSIGAAWVLFYLIARLGSTAALLNRYLVAGLSAAIALYWVFERAGMVLETL